MRSIKVTFNVDGIPTNVVVRKVARQRRFKILVDKIYSEYAISDQTNEIEYFDGVLLNDYLFEKACSLIHQYFPRCRAIEKVGEDNYEDYDDF